MGAENTWNETKITFSSSNKSVFALKKIVFGNILLTRTVTVFGSVVLYKNFSVSALSTFYIMLAVEF